jgi:hypothetical protein
MSQRFEEEFERVRIPFPQPIDPTDPTGALWRRGRALRAEAQRAALVWLGRRISRAFAHLLHPTRRRRSRARSTALDCG